VNILIIENDAEVADYTEEVLLNTPGIPSPSIVRASNGQEGAELLFSAAPELVIAEAHLPGADGVSILASFRQQNNTTPLIIIADSLEPDQMAHLRSLNVHSILFKPFMPEYLHQAVIGALNITV